MRVYILYIVAFVLPWWIASSGGRKPASIFVSDDRIYADKAEYSAIGSVHKSPTESSIVGTGFLVEPCVVATSYHLVKSTQEKISSSDYVYFRASEHEFVKASVVSSGRPYLKTVREESLEDWVLLKLEKCLNDVEPLQVKSMSFVDLQRKPLMLFGFYVDRDISRVSYDPNCLVSHEPNPYYKGLAHDCAVKTGSSGGPLVMKDGGQLYVVGIQSIKRKSFDEVFSEFVPSWSNVATPIKGVVQALRQFKETTSVR